MTDFAAARRMMVDGQVRTADVTDLRILAAMLDLPRERFFPDDKASLAYLDLDVAVSAPGQPVRRLLKPMVLAKLIQAADIAETDRVLDIGCATGYRHGAADASRRRRDRPRGGRRPGPAGRRGARRRQRRRQDRDRTAVARLRRRGPVSM